MNSTQWLGSLSSERSWSAIARFYDNCKKKKPGKKGFPKFKKHTRSVDYKTSGWKLSSNRKQITFTDKIRSWLEYLGKKYGTITIAVSPHNTSQDCSNCGQKVEKSLSTRTHVCPHCRYIEDRDYLASINILKRGLSTTGHVGTYAWGDLHIKGRLVQTCRLTASH